MKFSDRIKLLFQSKEKKPYEYVPRFCKTFEKTYADDRKIYSILTENWHKLPPDLSHKNLQIVNKTNIKLPF